MKRFLVLCVACLLTVLSSDASVFADQRDGRLDIYFIDVEGGAATLSARLFAGRTPRKGFRRAMPRWL